MTGSDRQLIKQAQSGCRESMRAIYEQHKDHLLTLARGLMGDRDLAEDIVHDVFVSFARAVGKLKLRGSLRGYLSIGVCNRVRDHFRRKIRQTGEPTLQTETPTPDAGIVHREAMERLCDALKTLPLEQREVVLLRVKADMPFATIAAQQGINANAARARYRYGIEKLRSVMEREANP